MKILEMLFQGERDGSWSPLCALGGTGGLWGLLGLSLKPQLPVGCVEV